MPYYCRSVGRLSKRRACGVVVALNVLARNVPIPQSMLLLLLLLIFTGALGG